MGERTKGGLLLLAIFLLSGAIYLVLLSFLSHPPIKPKPPAVIHTSHGDYRVEEKDIVTQPGCPKCLLLGLTIVDKKTIEIEREQCDEEKRDTMLHEAEHAELGEEFSDEDITGHEAIYKLTPVVIRLLKMNPELERYAIQR